MSDLAIEGKIMRIERAEKPSRVWWLYHVWGKEKPVAFGHDIGAKVRDTLSVAARDAGGPWFFATSKTPSITPADQPIFAVDESIFKNATGKAPTLAMPIVMWFTHDKTWTADDSYEDIRKLAPDNSPNICSLPVRYLVKLGYMHWNGSLRKSLRPNAHSRDLRVYERTLR